MNEELKKILEQMQGMKSATEAEVKTLKENIEALVKASGSKDEEIAELKAAVDNLEQKGAVNVYANEKEKKSAERAAARELFGKVLKTGLDTNGVQVQDIITESKGFTVADSSSAGAGIFEELSSDILTQLRETYTILSLIGSYQVQSTDHYRMVQKTWSQTSWSGENTSNTAPSPLATPTFEKISANFGKLTIDNFVTNESLVDPIFNVESFLMRDATEQAGRSIAQAFIDGTGPNTPNGIMTHFDETESVKPDYDPATPANERSKNRFGWRTTGDANGFPTDNQDIIDMLKNLILELKTPYLNGAVFLMNRRTFDAISRIKDAENRFYLQRDMSGKATAMFDGYPIKIEEHMPDIAANAIPVLFGDFKKAFYMIDYLGLSLLRNPYLVPGNVNFHWEQRVGSMMGDSWALKGLRCAV